MGALSSVEARLGHVEREGVEQPWLCIAAEVELGDIEPVDHVERTKVDPDVLVGRHDHGRVLRGLADHHGAMALVLELPAPLEGGHVDGGLRGRVGDDLVLNHDRGGEEAEDDEDRGDRVHDLERDVVLRLLRDVALLALLRAIAQHHEQDQQKRATADDDGRHAEALPELVRVAPWLRHAVKRAEGGQLAARKEQRSSDGEQDGPTTRGSPAGAGLDRSGVSVGGYRVHEERP